MGYLHNGKVTKMRDTKFEVPETEDMEDELLECSIQAGRIMRMWFRVNEGSPFNRASRGGADASSGQRADDRHLFPKG